MAQYTETILWALDIAAQIVLAVFVFRAQGWRDYLDSLKAELRESNRRELDNWFADVKRRLECGDEEFDDLNSRSTQMEIRIVKAVGDLKDWMRETFASRQDLKSHELSVATKFERLDEHQSQMSKDLAVLLAERRKD